MKKLKTVHLSVVAIFLITAFAAAAAAQEVIYISEPSVYDTPAILPRFEAPVQREFVRNPALLTLECPYEFFSDLTYHGGTYKTSTSGVWGPDGAGDTARGASDSSYYLHALGGDAGFAMKLSDTTNLAALIFYRWGFLFGDTDFEHFNSSAPGFIFGSWDERLNAHTFGLSILANHAFSDAFILGTGVTYSYNMEHLARKGSGDGRVGAAALFPETLLIDRDLRLNYHRFAPVVGILLKPSDRFTLDASVEAGFSFGGVSKNSLLYDDEGPAGNTWYTEDLDSRDLFGWDITAKVRPVIKISERLSFPLVLDFAYRKFNWGVDGSSYGYFAPMAYGGIFQGPGAVVYENDTRSWDITAGAGVTYDAGWATLAGMLSYTHWDFRNGYDQENWVSGPLGFLNGLTAYNQRDSEIRDTVSLGVMVEKKLSPVVSAALGLRYDLGWGRRDYYMSYFSPYEGGSHGRHVPRRRRA